MKDLIIEKFQENFKKRRKIYVDNPHLINVDIIALISEHKDLLGEDEHELWDELTKIPVVEDEFSLLDLLLEEFDVLNEKIKSYKLIIKELERKYNLNSTQIDLLKTYRN